MLVKCPWVVCVLLSICAVVPAPTPIGSSPTFFVSFHGGDGKKDINEIYRFSLDGTLLQKKIFSDGDERGLHGLRGLLYVESKEMMLITNAFNQDSRILKLDVGPTSDFACKGRGPALDFINDGSVLHPYGIQLNPVDQSITISNQGDVANPPQNITQYDLNGNALATPVFTTVGDPRDLYWATFADSAYLFICDKSTDRVLKYDSNGVQLKYTAKVTNPIALHSVTPPPGEGVIPWLLVSSNDASDSAVYALDFLTGGDTTGSKTNYKRKYADPQLDHPCGMATLGNVLYVLSQNTQSLLSFDLTTAKLISVVITKAFIPDIPEDLMLTALPECAISPPPTDADKSDTSKIPPLYFIASGATLGGALILGTIVYWCKRRRDYRRAKITPLAVQDFESPAIGSVQA